MHNPLVDVTAFNCYDNILLLLLDIIQCFIMCMFTVILGTTTCSTAYNCSSGIGSSTCVDGVCQCSDGYTATSDLKACLSKLSYCLKILKSCYPFYTL